jgi:hypothetical protein
VHGQHHEYRLFAKILETFLSAEEKHAMRGLFFHDLLRRAGGLAGGGVGRRREALPMAGLVLA